VLGKVEITGLENVPKSGPYLIAINHISIFDPPFIIAFWPISPEAVGAVDIWEKVDNRLWPNYMVGYKSIEESMTGG
jgi:1-acyl-sn-glycerol-3-phosphate acyltransferase